MRGRTGTKCTPEHGWRDLRPSIPHYVECCSLWQSMAVETSLVSVLQRALPALPVASGSHADPGQARCKQGLRAAILGIPQAGYPVFHKNIAAFHLRGPEQHHESCVTWSSRNDVLVSRAFLVYPRRTSRTYKYAELNLAGYASCFCFVLAHVRYVCSVFLPVLL